MICESTIVAATDSVMLDIPDEEIAKTRIMNSLASIQSLNAYQVKWTHKWKYDSVEESKSDEKVYGKLWVYSNCVFFN